MITDEELRQRVQNGLEDYWGTAWGEAEVVAFEKIIDLILDPESTRRSTLDRK